jgi:hypothetical protein
MNDAKYIGLDVHQATISATVLDSAGKLVMEAILETKAATILQFIQGLRGDFTSDLRGRYLCGLVARFAQTSRQASVGLRSAKECSVEGRKQK